ncbi:MAG: DUF6067 family protein [Dysgonamonadaceae bacterium]|nr:DUF6067 family protein [Dysgonamonadaceae bacterium]
MKNLLLYLAVLALCGTTWADNGNHLKNPALKIKANEKAIINQIDDGALEIIFHAGDGWPQIEVTALPSPEELNSLRLEIYLPENIEDNMLTLKGYPANTLNGNYFHSTLKVGEVSPVAFPILSADLNGFQIAAKNPKTTFRIVIKGIYYQQTNYLTEGYDFESPAEMGAWRTSVNAKIELSDEFAISGKQSLRMEWKDPNATIALIPDITDWRPYKQLRFYLNNPAPFPQKKMRILRVNNVRPGVECSLASGMMFVSPESVQEFVLDLETLPKSVDLSNVYNLHFYGLDQDVEVILHLDSMKLYTEKEVEVLTIGRAKKEIELTIEMLNKGKNIATGELSNKIKTVIADMQKLISSAPLNYNDELIDNITQARELAVLGSSSSGEKKSLILRGMPATEKIFRDSFFSGGEKSFELSAAGNERESFQVVALPLKDLKNVQVTATPLKSSNGNMISTKNIKINPVGYIEVEESFVYNSSRDGFWPDILVHNQKLNLSDRIQPYWITVYIPPNCKAGLYQGEIHFTTKDGVSERYPYKIKVHGFSLPIKGELLTYFDWRYNPENPVTRRKCYEIMLDHRLNPISMYTNGHSPDNEKTYKNTPHTDDLEYCISRGMNLLNIWYLYDPSNENPFEFSKEYQGKIKKFIDYYKPILEKKGAWDIAAINGFDEIMHRPIKVREKSLEEARKICTWLKKNYQEIRISNVGRKMDISTDLMDIWFTTAIQKEETQDITKKGGKTCFYWVYENPSPMLDLPGMAARILSWQAFKEDAKGIGYYSTYRPQALDCPYETAPTGVDWPKETINATSTTSRKSKSWRRGRIGCGNLFYPDRDGSVLPSTRLANVRDGVEDYEYLAMLKKLDPTHPLLTIPDEIVTLANDDYTKDFEVIEKYRRQVAKAIEDAIENKKQ